MYLKIKEGTHLVFKTRSGCVMAQEFSRRPVTAGHWFEHRLVCVEFVMGKVVLGIGFSPSSQVLPPGVIPIAVNVYVIPYIHMLEHFKLNKRR
jgi:hypothetical protein